MPYFTVFTPTYNRAYILPKLYQSLREQTCKDFEWMIVDDGSTDDTGKLVAQWEDQNNGFDIHYYKIQNGGKPRAINFGITKANGDFFFMVDSDDHLTTDAVQKMLLWCKEIEDDLVFSSFNGSCSSRDMAERMAGVVVAGVPHAVAHPADNILGCPRERLPLAIHHDF